MNMGNGVNLIPGPQPGLIQDAATGQYYDAKIRSDRAFYDTELITDPVTAGQSYFYFRNLNFPTGIRKTSIYTNMTIEHSFPSGWNAEIRGIGFRALKQEIGGVWTTADDMMRVLEEGAMQFMRSNQREEAQGRLDMFPSKYGLNIFANGIIIPDISMVNNGVPSAAAVPGLIYPIKIQNGVTFEIEVEFPNGFTLDADTLLMCELYTTLVQPLA